MFCFAFSDNFCLRIWRHTNSITKIYKWYILSFDFYLHLLWSILVILNWSKTYLKNFNLIPTWNLFFSEVSLQIARREICYLNSNWCPFHNIVINIQYIKIAVIIVFLCLVTATQWCKIKNNTITVSIS
jgi:hypothetical protein